MNQLDKVLASREPERAPVQGKPFLSRGLCSSRVRLVQRLAKLLENKNQAVYQKMPMDEGMFGMGY